jgi:hypothetical protein
VRRTGLGRTGRDQGRLRAREPCDHPGGLPHSRAHLLPAPGVDLGTIPTGKMAGATGPTAPRHARLEHP